MKWMIASDIHGSEYYCRQMLDAYRGEKADRLLLLGDILYHGPRNDLPRDYNPKKVTTLLNEMKRHILCVRGNCDTEVDQMVLEFPILADYAILTAGNQMIFPRMGIISMRMRCPPAPEGRYPASWPYPRTKMCGA